MPQVSRKKSRKIGTGKSSSGGNKLERKLTKGNQTVAEFIPRNITGVPDMTVVKLKFFTTLIDFTASVGYYGHVFRLNSVFDPDYTGVGAQPAGFDQWAAFYNQYRVLGCMVKVSALATNNGTNPPIVFGFYPNLSASTESSIDNALEKPRCYFSCASWSDTSGRVVKKNLRPAAVMGITEQAYASTTDSSALVSSNPSSQAYFTVFCYNLNGTWSATAANNPTLWVELEYEVQFYGRVDLDQSFKKFRALERALPTDVTPDEICQAVEFRRSLTQKLESTIPEDKGQRFGMPSISQPINPNPSRKPTSLEFSG